MPSTKLVARVIALPEGKPVTLGVLRVEALGEDLAALDHPAQEWMPTRNPRKQRFTVGRQTARQDPTTVVRQVYPVSGPKLTQEILQLGFHPAVPLCCQLDRARRQALACGLIQGQKDEAEKKGFKFRFAFV